MIPTVFKSKTVASVTAVFQKAIADLAKIEQEQDAKVNAGHLQRQKIEADYTNRLHANDLLVTQAISEAEHAAKVRAKLEEILA